jgi:hypothetical protein
MEGCAGGSAAGRSPDADMPPMALGAALTILTSRTRGSCSMAGKVFGPVNNSRQQKTRHWAGFRVFQGRVA